MLGIDHSSIARSHKTAVLFDFFDTIALRQVRRPGDQFLHLYHHLPRRIKLLFPDCKQFQIDRIQAEQKGRQTAPGNETDLYSIWSILLGPRYEDLVAAGTSSEEAYEANTLMLDTFVADLIKECNSSEKTVAVVSDTYFTSSYIHQILSSKFGLSIPREHIFCSNEFGCSKVSGLWEIAAEYLDVSPSQAHVFGDNYLADVVASRKIGFTSTLLPNGTSDLWQVISLEEKSQTYLTEDSINLDLGISSIRARFARQCNLKGSTTDYEHFGGAILGPVFSGFAHWIGKKLRDAQVTHLIALKREGGFLADLVKMTSPDTFTSSEFHVSRRSLVLPSIFECTEDELNSIFSLLPQVNSVEEVTNILGLPADMPLEGERFNSSCKEDLFRAISANEVATAQILKNATCARIGFLCELERSLSSGESRSWPDSIHIVDLGWGGTIPQMMSRILLRSGIHVRIEAYFLVSAYKPQSDTRDISIHSYLQPQARDLILESAGVLEQICSDHSNPTLEFNSNGVALGTSSTPLYQKIQANRIRTGISGFLHLADDLALSAKIPWDRVEVRSHLVSIVERFLLHPTAGERQLFAGWTHDDTSKLGLPTPLISSLLQSEFRDFLTLHNLRKVLPPNSFWPYAHRKTLTEAGQSRADHSTRTCRVQIFDTSKHATIYDEDIAVDDGSVFTVIDMEPPISSSVRVDLTDRPSLLSNISFSAWHRVGEGESLDVLSPLQLIKIENAITMANKIYLTNNDPRLYFDLPQIEADRLRLVLAFHVFPIKETPSVRTTSWRKLLNQWRVLKSIESSF
jgi:predicted HAD superfamily hydrolase